MQLHLKAQTQKINGARIAHSLLADEMLLSALFGLQNLSGWSSWNSFLCDIIITWLKVVTSTLKVWISPYFTMY